MRFILAGCCATANRIVDASIRAVMNSRRRIDRTYKQAQGRRQRRRHSTPLAGAWGGQLREFNLTTGTGLWVVDVRDGSRLCKNVFPPPKTARKRGRSASTRRSEHIFALSSPESTRAQARATLSDLNGHTMRITARAPHARIATRSGLMPTMFITRVRL